MNRFLCLVNFKENFTKNPNFHFNPTATSEKDALFCPIPQTYEHTAMFCTDSNCYISRICEGYQFIIVFDGNLHDTDELLSELSSLGYRFHTGNDAEIALFSYIHFGESCLDKLCGSFTFIIYDTMRRQIFAVNHLHSSRPLFYAKFGDDCIISTRPDDILSNASSIHTDYSRLNAILCFEPPYESCFSEMHTLDPMHKLLITKKCLALREYAYSSQDTCANYFQNSENLCVLVPGCYTCNDAKSLFQNRSHIQIYSFRKYCNDNHNIILKYPDSDITAILTETVKTCGAPILSELSYILPIYLNQLPKNASAAILSPNVSNTARKKLKDLLLENKMYYSQVANTIMPTIGNYTNDIVFCAELFAAQRGISLSVLPSMPNLDLSSYTYADDASKSSETALRRTLLEIAAKDNAPILSFFKKGSLLKLCESKYDFSKSGYSVSALMAYLIQLNIWFELYHPLII